MATSMGAFDSEFTKAVCQRMAGAYFSEMEASFERTVARLSEPDPKARIAALFMIREYWKTFPDFKEVCEKLAFEDEDSEVRNYALSSLCRVGYGTYDSRLGKRLAELVLDNGQPDLRRRVAYTALRAVWRNLGPEQAADEFRFPEDVDWAFVQSFVDRLAAHSMPENGTS